MGANISSFVFQPLLLGIASVLMIIALIYQDKSSTCNKNTDPWGGEVFKIDMGIATVILITAVIIHFISAFMVNPVV